MGVLEAVWVVAVVIVAAGVCFAVWALSGTDARPRETTKGRPRPGSYQGRGRRSDADGWTGQSR